MRQILKKPDSFVSSHRLLITGSGFPSWSKQLRSRYIMDLKDNGEVVQSEVTDLKPVHVDPVGTVRLIDHNELVLIPTPSPDPRGTLTFVGSLFGLSNNNQIRWTCRNGGSGL